jgi:hypothetical protein
MKASPKGASCERPTGTPVGRKADARTVIRRIHYGDAFPAATNGSAELGGALPAVAALAIYGG